MLKMIGKLGVAVLLLLMLVGAIAWYGNAKGERNAQLFCDAIPLGSELGAAIAAFKKEPRSSAALQYAMDDQAYRFVFHAFVFDSAVCDVTTDARQRISSKKVDILYD